MTHHQAEAKAVSCRRNDVTWELINTFGDVRDGS